MHRIRVVGLRRSIPGALCIWLTQPAHVHCENVGFGAQTAFIPLINSIHEFFVLPATEWCHQWSLKCHSKSVEARKTPKRFVKGQLDSTRKCESSSITSVDAYPVCGLSINASSTHYKGCKCWELLCHEGRAMQCFGR